MMAVMSVAVATTNERGGGKRKNYVTEINHFQNHLKNI